MIKNRLVLIDAYALIFRAYYSIPANFTDKEGNPTNAVYGFTSALLTAIKELEPEYLAIGIDVGKSKHRDEYKEYKAHRPPAPDDLKVQVPVVKKIAEAMNIPLFGVEGYEGEDVIATIIKQTANRLQTTEKAVDNRRSSVVESIIVTGDMDTLQLIDEHTFVYVNGRNGQPTTLYDENKVKERYGLTPSQFVDYKALRGDPSDNIPGVKGIGEKGAAKLIQEFGSLEKLYEQITKSELQMTNEISNEKMSKNQKISEKIKTLLLENKEIAFLSQKLATIQRDAPIEFNLKDARIHDYDQKKVIELFGKLGFRSLISRLHEEKRPQSKQQSLF